MGIQDREYYQYEQSGQVSLRPRSMVGTLILVTVGVWLLQLLFRGQDVAHGGHVTRFLGCTAEQIFSGFPQVWRLLTANFVHHWSDPWHLVGNMLFLFFFGRDLERILGSREFVGLYLVSGTIAIFAEIVAQHVLGNSETLILGGSGAVMAIVVLMTCISPTRKVLVFFFIPTPIWVLCAIFLFQDLARAVGSPDGVASFAHLFGAAYGFLFWRYDLRWSRARRWMRTRRPGPARDVESSDPPASPSAAAESELSQRIDALLDKIHATGLDSLSDEERHFLEQNSSKYRRP